MGKATVISHQGDGLYRVKRQIDTARADAEITSLQAEDAELTSRISQQYSDIDSIQLDVDYAEQVLDAAIHAGDESAITDARQKLNSELARLYNARQVLRLLQLRQTYVTKRTAWLQQETSQPAEVDAWCADLTTDLSGDVGTCEVGRGSTGIIIRPGYPGAAHDPARDGIHQPVASSTPAATAYNFAIRPGLEKWRPRYRTGTIHNIDTNTDTCDVILDAATSAQNLDINQAPTLTGVPVEYMTCNAAAFTEGDEVLVEFTGMDWSQPKVIGFVHDPKGCSGRWLLFEDSATWQVYVIDLETLQETQYATLADAEADIGVPFSRMLVGAGEWIPNQSSYNSYRSQGQVGTPYLSSTVTYSNDEPDKLDPSDVDAFRGELELAYDDAVTRGEIQQGDPYDFTASFYAGRLEGYTSQASFDTGLNYNYSYNESRADHLISGHWDPSTGFDFTTAVKKETTSGSATLLDGQILTASQTKTNQRDNIDWLSSSPQQTGTYTETGSGTWYRVSHYRGTQVIIKGSMTHQETTPGHYETAYTVTDIIIRPSSPLIQNGNPAWDLDYDYAQGQQVTLTNVVNWYNANTHADLTTFGPYIADRG